VCTRVLADSSALTARTPPPPRLPAANVGW
jgi:hypothetical protein